MTAQARASHIKPGTKVISITSAISTSSRIIRTSSASRQSIIAMAADAEATLPALIEAVKQALPADRKAAMRRAARR